MPTPQPILIHCLTRVFQGRARAIISPVEITNTSTQAKETTQGIWDTGATGSAITSSLAKKLGLVPIGSTKVNGVHGEKNGVNVYGVKITLNNQNVSFTLPVTECEQLSSDDSACFLIGMDVIGQGDFAISNVGGTTVMTFRVPSIERFDFVTSMKAQAEAQKTNAIKQANADYMNKIRGKKYK